MVYQRKIPLILAVLFVLAACSPASPAAEKQAAAPSTGHSLLIDRGELFSASGACASCHQTMVDEGGNDVSVDAMWRSTMLANAARDPYWLATVRSEVIQAPQHNAVIQKKCATCHMPMAEVTLLKQGQAVSVLDQGLAGSSHPLHNLAMDGVSCSLCHQVEEDNLGAPDSFSGGFLIDTQIPKGERMAYGIFEIDASQTALMQGPSGFIPHQSMHVQQSEVCGNCHDLYTPYLDSSGEVAGEFPEQLVYSEWANSGYANEISCQECHMPQAQGSVKLSITGSPQREPFFQHEFVGGNAFMLRILQKNSQALQVTAAPEHFEASITRATDQISTQTARLTLQQPRVEAGMLLAEISIENLAGHKFPSGYPSRRAWLQVRVTDQQGKLIFESGAVKEDGSITGNDNDADPAQYEPHYTLLTSPDQVQVYEGIMINSDGQVTTTLLRGSQFIKDNRLLPAGFQPNPDQPDINPRGEAAQDANFTAGKDILSLQVETGDALGPFTLEVSLLYQSIAYRWAENLRQESGAEIEQFGQMYESVPNLPLVAASIQAIITP